MPKEFEKDPSAKLDYKFVFAPRTAEVSSNPDVTDYLESGEIISSFEISASPINGGSTITLSGSSLTDSNTSVLYWAEGGELYKDNNVTVRITTSSGRIDERTMKIKLVNK